MGMRVHGLHPPARYGQLAAFAWCHADLRRMKSGLDQTAAADEYSGRCGPSARDIFQELSAIWHCLLLTVLPSSGRRRGDRKSTRLNSSHLVISYAVFCLKKKKKK